MGSEAGETTAELTAFWVAPQQRAQGVGGALVQRVAEWAAAMEIKTLKAWVMETNYGAIAFYKKIGFQETGQREPDKPDASKWMMLMACDIGPQAAQPLQGLNESDKGSA